MIAEPIGRREVLLPINHNYNTICDILGFFVIKTQEISKFCKQWKKLVNRTRAMTRTLLLQCPISAGPNLG